MKRTIAALVLAMLLAPQASAQYGDVTLTFQYGGSPFAAPKVTPTKDVEFCGMNKMLIDDSLLVNSANKGVANIVVQVYVSPGKTAPKAAPSYAEWMDSKVVVDNKGCMFVPHVSVAHTGQTVILRNSDAVGHNTKIDAFKNPPQNPIIPANSEQETKFAAAESLPMKVSCNIHPWMGSWLVVQDHPYVGVSDADGKVTLKDVPAGKWTLRVWHEKAGYIEKVTLDGKSASWRRGRFDVTVKAVRADECGHRGHRRFCLREVTDGMSTRTDGVQVASAWAPPAAGALEWASEDARLRML